MSSIEPRASFLQRFGVPFAAGVPGILALVLSIYLTVDPANYPGNLSGPLLAVLSAINPLILLATACLLGAYTTPRVGLRSYLIDRVALGDPIWPRLRGEARTAVVLGVAGGGAVLLLDVGLSPFIAQDVPSATLAAAQPSLLGVLVNIPVRFLYGGITEELLLRYGLLSALAFGGWVITGRQGVGPSSAVMWFAIVVSAVLFGLGHLPAVSQAVGLTPLLVARTILLNAVLGLAFGWLYWRHSLEAAMIGHMSAHVPLTLYALVQVLFL